MTDSLCVCQQKKVVLETHLVVWTTTGWLKLKYPPDKMQFLDNSVRFLYPNFLVYMGEILLQFSNF